MTIEQKRKHLLNLFNATEKEIKIYIENYGGPGWFKRIKRLLYHREKYLNYALKKLGIIPAKEVKAKTFWGKEFVLPVLDGIARSIYFFGSLSVEEHRLIKFFIKNLKKDDIFFDIGANFGFYSALAGELIENGEIHSFEPSPRTFDYLRKAFYKNKNFYFKNVALSDKKRKLFFYDGFIAGHSGGITVLKEVASIILSKYQQIEIRSTTLDDYIKNHSKPTVIKMDVEGAESQIIKGGQEFLKDNNPVIAMEVVGMKRGGEFSLRAIENLYDLGFKSYQITEEGNLELLEELHPEKIFDEQSKVDNFIFKK